MMCTSVSGGGVCACVCRCLRSGMSSDPWGWSRSGCEAGLEQNLEHALNHRAIAPAQDFGLLRQDLPLTILSLLMWTRVASGQFSCVRPRPSRPAPPCAEILSMKHHTWPVRKNFIQDTRQADGLLWPSIYFHDCFPSEFQSYPKEIQGWNSYLHFSKVK